MQLNPLQKKAANNFYLFISSAAIGWMIGMSISPVIQTVVSTIIAVLLGVAALLSGLSINETETGKTLALFRKNASIHLWPMALFILGLMAGEISGILTRTHGILEELAAVHTPKDTTQKEISSNKELEDLGVLFNDTTKTSHLDNLLVLHGPRLERGLIDLEIPIIERWVGQCQGDSACLELIKYIVCERRR
jgi:hypothetical protein